MAEDFSLYDFVRSLSIVGWIALTAAMTAVIYILAKGTELLVTRKCPFCRVRNPRRAVSCGNCGKAIG